MSRKMFLLLAVFAAVLSGYVGVSYAGAPPSFGITADAIKLGDIECDTWRNGMHGLIVNGPNVYAVRISKPFSEKEVMLDKSIDYGQTWLKSTGIARGSEIDTCGSGFAITPDGQSLHYVWDAYEPLLTPIMNTYYGNGTTTKTRVNGSINVATGQSVIAVDGSGDIHILFSNGADIYYTSSSNGGETFSQPTFVVPGYFFSFTADSDGNLYLAYKAGSAHYFTKKLAGGNTWSDGDILCSDCPGNDPSMVVFDSNRIYIAMGNIIRAYSFGVWNPSLHTVPNSNPSWPHSSLAVDSNGLLNFAWSETDGSHFARTTKPHDPTSWGQAVLAIPGADLPNVAVDSNGKAYIIANKASTSIAVFTKEK